MDEQKKSQKRAIDMLVEINENNPKNKVIMRKNNKIVADLMEVQIASMLNHEFVDEFSHDSKTGINKRPIEIKTVIVCSTDQLTLNNVDGKEDIVTYVDAGILDKKRKLFFIPKRDRKMYGVRNKEDKTYSYCLDQEVPEGYERHGNLVDKNAGGKIMIPRNYRSKGRETWKKVYFRNREFTRKQIMYLCEIEEKEQDALMEMFNIWNEAKRQGDKKAMKRAYKETKRYIKKNEELKRLKKKLKFYPIY